MQVSRPHYPPFGAAAMSRPRQTRVPSQALQPADQVRFGQNQDKNWQSKLSPEVLDAYNAFQASGINAPVKLSIHSAVRGGSPELIKALRNSQQINARLRDQDSDVEAVLHDLSALPALAQLPEVIAVRLLPIAETEKTPVENSRSYSTTARPEPWERTVGSDIALAYRLLVERNTNPQLGEWGRVQALLDHLVKNDYKMRVLMDASLDITPEEFAAMGVTVHTDIPSPATGKRILTAEIDIRYARQLGEHPGVYSLEGGVPLYPD